MSDPAHTTALGLIDKLRHFIDGELNPEERVMMASLLAPGVIAAYAGDEVAGFDAGWGPSILPDALAQALVEEGVKIEGLDL